MSEIGEKKMTKQAKEKAKEKMKVAKEEAKDKVSSPLAGKDKNTPGPSKYKYLSGKKPGNCSGCGTQVCNSCWGNQSSHDPTCNECRGSGMEGGWEARHLQPSTKCTKAFCGYYSGYLRG